ncbi:hypothetical protein AF332_22695 [Sporosarcina globispora]|uniref:RsgI N-terminal anti-sigma domain-containing protein n=1 Tax=Sporosarcina globispora TaxID=1459 RepID=A0A0M0GHE3_SPOGL|nr:anti-sigma factor domain-containing protein [Sporosarcina globispora]KON89340.1 hypothetical protein AF332_22695 [Sporosarcina globispora]
MKTGIIMEINERFLTLLTPEGEFLRARKQDRAYVIGQEIEFFPIELKTGKKSYSLSNINLFRGKGLLAGAFALMLAIVSFLPFLQNDEVYAYMSIDVNPSIELGVNQEYRVVELVPYNEEGERIIQSIENWKKKSIHEVADKILFQIKEQGYFKEKREVVIAAVYTEENNEMDERIQAELADIKEAAQKEKLEVTLLEASEEEREAAIEKGLTPGLYKENKLKAEDNKNKKSEAANQEKRSDVESHAPQIPAADQQNQLKKQEKTEVSKEKPAVPGQIMKSENRESPQNNRGKSNGNHERHDNQVKIEPEKNEKAQKPQNQPDEKKNHKTNGNRSNLERTPKEKDNNGKNRGGNGPEKNRKDRDNRNNPSGNEQ